MLRIVPVFRLCSIWCNPHIKGVALACCVFIRRDLNFTEQMQTLGYEAVRIRQQWKYWLLGFVLLYLFSTSARLHLEAEAFASAVKRGMKLDEAAWHMVHDRHRHLECVPADVARHAIERFL